ncbi:septum formation inhibitor Maf [Helicobacter anatolicus]|uniref:septum formation inhibitor Maf n=1 Tax=Helicobacter anatolicus TaxID=2905874 RepID=UPI001E3D7CD1|nr:septum formation inhibitor Maf [Helicobacter anatolicus]MCE3039542.1 septum formation inhibitor Maf [Helicobacter anatolicus]
MITLVSNSPTRQKILREYQIAFQQVSIDFDEESIASIVPKTFAYEACKHKLERALQELGSDCAILVADSVVSVSSCMQRKPKTKEEAREMLEKQSGQEIAIITAQILKTSKIEVCDISQTILKLQEFHKIDLKEYLESSLWQGKAGAVMVEGFHSKYIIKQKGLFSTALGLSVEKFLPFFAII